MTERAPFTQLQDLSTTLATLVASKAPSVPAVQSHRSRSSGFVWRPGLIVTADEALSEDGEFAPHPAPLIRSDSNGADDGLPALVHMNMLNPHELRAAAP
jgi:hypothetical protein